MVWAGEDAGAVQCLSAGVCLRWRQVLAAVSVSLFLFVALCLFYFFNFMFLPELSNNCIAISQMGSLIM